MTEPMDKVIERLDELAKAATPGPWKPTPAGAALRGPSRKHVTHAGTEYYMWVEVAKITPTGPWKAERRANAAFIAAANPQPIRQLIAAYREQREATRHLSRLVRVYGDMLDGNGNTPTEIRHAQRFLSALNQRGE